MARPKTYENLILWQNAMALARSVYELTQDLPSKEKYGLVAQARRAAVSIPSNIAEGFGRLTDTQFRHFLGNARGSLYELQTQLRLSQELGYIAKEAVHPLIEQSSEVGRLLNALISSLSKQRTLAGVTSSANSASPAPVP